MYRYSPVVLFHVFSVELLLSYTTVPLRFCVCLAVLHCGGVSAYESGCADSREELWLVVLRD